MLNQSKGGGAVGNVFEAVGGERMLEEESSGGACSIIHGTHAG